MSGYNYGILVLSLLLFINVSLFDNSQNSGIGFRTKRSMASKKIWVFSQKVFYGITILVSALSVTLNHFKILDSGQAVALSIAGMVVSGVIVQGILIYRGKKDGESKA